MISPPSGHYCARRVIRCIIRLYSVHITPTLVHLSHSGVSPQNWNIERKKSRFVAEEAVQLQFNNTIALYAQRITRNLPY